MLNHFPTLGLSGSDASGQFSVIDVASAMSFGIVTAFDLLTMSQAGIGLYWRWVLGQEGIIRDYARILDNKPLRACYLDPGEYGT